jgi:hypothetical protein
MTCAGRSKSTENQPVSCRPPAAEQGFRRHDTSSGPPYFQLQAPLVWTTLALTVRADGSSSFEVVGAAPFLRHWVYDTNGVLSAKIGLADFRSWYHGKQGRHTPWGDEDTPALVTAVETALERELSTHIMRAGAKPAVRTVLRGHTLTEQGALDDELYLLLDGVVAVEVNNRSVAEVGPGAVIGKGQHWRVADAPRRFGPSRR